jgi:glycine cleavage system P protein (glycine dehydrogenase) subunit 1
MTYIPHTEKEREAMLAAIGVATLDELFEDVPAKHRFPQLGLPPALTEMEAMAELQSLAAENGTAAEMAFFLGAGVYHHYIPSAVDHILRRGEFYTAYTPYQPEISQGTLQAVFEYQSLMVALTGMEASNASHYDGSTATAEALNLAFANFRGKRRKVVISPAVHPQYRETLRTYSGGMGVTLAGDEAENDPLVGPDALAALLDADTALAVVQYPDFFGRIYDYTAFIEAAHSQGALVCVVANPTSLAMLKTPGSMGADIVVGEGQPLGIPMWYGGPYLGFFTTRKQYVHKMAGRLVGETVDSRGQRAYVLTLTAREQHIKRERATSNICTNQGLLALCASAYLSLLGQKGLRQVADLCYQKAHYAAAELSTIKGFGLCFSEPYFHEFALCCPKPVAEINERLLDYGIIGGYDLGRDYPFLKDHMLIAVTEMNSREEIDTLVEVIREVAND